MTDWVWRAVVLAVFIACLIVLGYVDRRLSQRQAEVAAYFRDQLDQLDRDDQTTAGVVAPGSEHAASEGRGASTLAASGRPTR